MLYQPSFMLYPQMGWQNFLEPVARGGFQWIYKGKIYPVYAEKRGKRYYWYMRKMIDRQVYKVYLSPAGKLEPGLMDNAAMYIIELAVSPDKQKES